MYPRGFVAGKRKSDMWLCVISDRMADKEMNVTTEPLTEMERLLLMAAAVLGFGPDRDLSSANTWKVIAQVLTWSGWAPDEFRARWKETDGDSAL